MANLGNMPIFKAQKSLANPPFLNGNSHDIPMILCPGRELSRTSSMVHQCLAERAAEWNALPTSPVAWTARHRMDLDRECPWGNHGKICPRIDPLGYRYGKPILYWLVVTGTWLDYDFAIILGSCHHPN